MYNATHFTDWIANDMQSLAHKLDVGYFKHVDEEPSDWNFHDEKDRYTGFLNYLNYIWLFKYYYCGIIYDKYENKEYDIPAEDATIAAFNLHLRSNEEYGLVPFYALFSRNLNKRQRCNWFLKSIILRNGKTEEESILHLDEDKSPGPKTLIETVLPTHVVFSSFATGHFFERLSRLPKDVRERIRSETELADLVLNSIFGAHEKGKDDVYRYNRDQHEQNTVEFFEPDYLIEKWYAEAPRGNSPDRLLNPNTNSFLYPICVDDELVPDAALVFERIQQMNQFANLTGNTIYSLRYAYRNALLVRGLLGMEDTWLTRKAVEDSIRKGCL